MQQVQEPGALGALLLGIAVALQLELQDAGAGRGRDGAQHTAGVCAQGDIKLLRPAAGAACCTAN